MLNCSILIYLGHLQFLQVMAGEYMYQVSKFVHPITRAVGSPHPQKLFTHRQRNTHLERPIFLSQISGQQSENLCDPSDFCNLSALRDDRCHWVTLSDTIWGSSWIIGCIDHCTKSLSLHIWTSEHVNIWLCTLVQLHQSFALQWASHYTQTFR